MAQAQSNTFARTGSASHGSSLSDIAARFAKVGYHPGAYDEAFDFFGEGGESVPVPVPHAQPRQHSVQ